MKIRMLPRGVVLGVALATLPACAGSNLGALGDILGGVMNPGGGGQQQGQVVAEIQSVDTRQQAIQIRTQEGQTGTVFFDQNTVVIYRQQQYPVTALERGDVASIQLQQTQNRMYASRIEVQQSVQERTGQQQGGAAGQLVQMSGRVGQIDQERGMFQLQTQQGTVVVTLRYNPGPATNDYFRRLRTGDTVRVEGSYTSDGRLELSRFY